MLPNEKPFSGCNDGSEMWRDNAVKYGIDEALIICRNYLDMNLKREHPDDERQFSRELFSEMLHATATEIKPNKLIYALDSKMADYRNEMDYYHKSRELNIECARGIDRLINDSCYKTNHFNLEMAAMCAIQDYGFLRVCLVLAFNFQHKSKNMRLSAKNKNWANSFTVPENVFCDAHISVHAILLDGFCDYLRELYHDLNAERFMLHGNEEHSEFVGNVEIKHAITISDDGKGFSTGYAIGHNPDAVEPWVCWQFAVRDGERHYNWGIYGSEQYVIDAYNSRIFVAFN